MKRKHCLVQLKTTLFFSCVKWGYVNYGKSHNLKHRTFCLFLIESRNCCGICFLDLLLFTRSLTVLGKLESALQPCQEDRALVRSEPGSMLLDLGVGRASFGVFSILSFCDRRTFSIILSFLERGRCLPSHFRQILAILSFLLENLNLVRT